MPGIVLNSGDIASNKTDKVSDFMKLLVHYNFNVIKIKYGIYTDIQIYKAVIPYAPTTQYRHIIPCCDSILVTNPPFLNQDILGLNQDNKGCIFRHNVRLEPPPSLFWILLFSLTLYWTVWSLPGSHSPALESRPPHGDAAPTTGQWLGPNSCLWSAQWPQSLSLSSLFITWLLWVACS